MRVSFLSRLWRNRFGWNPGYCRDCLCHLFRQMGRGSGCTSRPLASGARLSSRILIHLPRFSMGVLPSPPKPRRRLVASQGQGVQGLGCRRVPGLLSPVSATRRRAGLDMPRYQEEVDVHSRDVAERARSHRGVPRGSGMPSRHTEAASFG